MSTAGTERRLKLYCDLLLQWQKTINLVAPSTIQDAWLRHFDDSLQLLEFIPDRTATIVDIGSGGGFPGLVIAIAKPQINIHLVESDARKCAFLRTVSRETSCANVTIHQNRIEDMIEAISADCITSRALASLDQLIVTCEPLWKNRPDISMILPKGKNWQSELTEARKKFNFNLQNVPSRTDPQAQILIVNKIANKAD